MNLNDVKVLIFAFVAFFVLLVRVDGRTRYGRKNSSSGNNTEGQAFNDIYSPFDNVNSSYSGLLNNLTLNSSSTSSHSKERDSISYDSSSSEYDSSHYTEEKSKKKRKQHPKRKWGKRQRDSAPAAGDDDQRCGSGYGKLCCDGATADSDCGCRCTDVKVGTGAPYSCPASKGAFDEVPTLVSVISNGDGAGGPGGSDSSTASRTTTIDLMSILRIIGSTGLLVVVISCVLLICAF